MNEQKAGFMCSTIVVTMNIYFELLFIALVYNSASSLWGAQASVLHGNFFFFFLLCRIEQG